MRVLLIWELNPESVDAYLINNPTAEQLDVLAKANGTMLNAAPNREAEVALGKISDALCTLEEHCDPHGDLAWKCIWNEKKVEFPVQGPISMVFKSGFYL